MLKEIVKGSEKDKEKKKVEGRKGLSRQEKGYRSNPITRICLIKCLGVLVIVGTLNSCYEPYF